MHNPDAPAVPLDRRFEEKLYAGVLGKLIGVYLGRPFEGWDNATIERRLGPITDYVHEQLGTPLIVTDDDISGTLTFVRAFEDSGLDYNISAATIGASWLNYIIEGRSILWWGGMGNSTEHTAYLRLKNGVAAPLSGAIETNGKTVAEQIGAQIFIDCWAMLCPGDPEQAAELARRAGSVSHDGEALHGAAALAAMEAEAFANSNIDHLLDAAASVIPADSLIRRLHDDVRGWHAQSGGDWHRTFKTIQQTYGYDKYGGNCHMVPNHGLIVMGLLHSNGDFGKALEVVNTAGWDTDCNSGNLGCLMGIRGGLDGLTPHLRDPVADRCYVPTAEGSRAVTDAWTESQRLIGQVRAAYGEGAPDLAEAALNFAMPGAVQGFRAQRGSLRQQSFGSGDGALLLHGDAGAGALVLRDVFIESLATSKYFHQQGYALMATPQINAGQILHARLSAADAAQAQVALCIMVYNADDELELLHGDTVELTTDARYVTWQLPPTNGYPIAQVGVRCMGGDALLHSMHWSGTPDLRLTRTAGGSMWQRAWVDAVDVFWTRPEAFRLVHNAGTGLISYGCHSWQDYAVSADVTVHMAQRAGVAARYQGLRRYYALELNAADQRIELVRRGDTREVLASAASSVEFGRTYQLRLEVAGSSLRGWVDDTELSASDDEFTSGGVALTVDTGRTATTAVTIAPLTEDHSEA